jgi:hypothetical protein
MRGGDIVLAVNWMHTPKKLNFRTPLDCIQTEVGSQEVEDLISRREHRTPVSAEPKSPTFWRSPAGTPLLPSGGQKITAETVRQLEEELP